MGTVISFETGAPLDQQSEREVRLLRGKLIADTLDDLKKRVDTGALNSLRAGDATGYDQAAYNEQELVRGEVAAGMLEHAAFEMRVNAVLYDEMIRENYLPTMKVRITEAAKRGATSIALRAAEELFAPPRLEEHTDLSEERPRLSPEERAEITKYLWISSLLSTTGNDLLLELCNKYPHLKKTERASNLPPTT
jgi:hypothetical protein